MAHSQNKVAIFSSTDFDNHVHSFQAYIFPWFSLCKQITTSRNKVSTEY